MEIFGVVILALCTVLFGALLKKSNREYALLLSLAAVGVLCLLFLDRFSPLKAQLEAFADRGIDADRYMGVLFRAVGVTMAGQLASQLCRDAGEGALAGAVELFVKAVVLTCCLPLLTEIFGYLEMLMV